MLDVFLSAILSSKLGTIPFKKNWHYAWLYTWRYIGFFPGTILNFIPRSIPGAMLGPFPREIHGAKPSEIPIAIPCAMSSSIARFIPSTMRGTITSTIPSEIPGYFPSTNFGANVGTISNVMSDFFQTQFLSLNLVQFLAHFLLKF